MAAGSLQIARMFGIPVLVHWSFGLLFVYVLYFGFSKDLEPFQILWLGFFVLAMFVCIVLHEFGHALTARKFGVETRDVILLPIGGIARLERLPEKPMQEFKVAIAGPLVNVAIALLLVLYFFLVHPSKLLNQEIIKETDLIGNYYFFIPALIFLNLMLAVFNLIPAFPMDGGRIFRALLSAKIGRAKATKYAALLGQAIAVLMFVYGIWEYSFTISLIGIFIFFTAAQEYKWVRAESTLGRFTARDILRREFTRLRPGDSLQTALGFLLGNVERHFLVFNEENQPVGALDEATIMETTRNGDAGALVGEVFNPQLAPVYLTDSLKRVYEKMQQSGSQILPVFDDENLIGVVDGNTLQRLLFYQLKKQ